MIQFKKLLTKDEVKRVLERDKLYETVCYAKDFDSWEPEMVFNWLVGMENNQEVGVLLLVHESKTSLSFHAGIYDEFKGNGKRYLDEITDMFRHNLPTFQVWTKVFEDNVPAIKCLLANNFKQTGSIPCAKDNMSLLIFSEKQLWG